MCDAPVFAEDGFKGRSILKGMSNLTGYTLNKGEFTIGLGSVSFGITDQVQVGTNILLYLFQIYNADLKVTLMNSESVTVAAGSNFSVFNLEVFGADTGFTSFSPYVAVSKMLTDKTTLHVGGQYSFFSGDADIEDADVTAVSKGTSFYAGLEYSFSNRTKFLTEGGYDTTFDGFRFGGAVLFGWKKFRLKLVVNYFKPESTQGFTLPVIGLWWRFKG